MTLAKPLRRAACAKGLVSKNISISPGFTSTSTFSHITLTIAFRLNHEGYHSCASHRGYMLSGLVAPNLDTSRNRSSSTDSYSACCAPLGVAFRLAYGVLSGWHESH